MVIGQKMTNILVIIIKIFLIGMVLQFFLQTFVTFILGAQGGYYDLMWLRKEIVVVGLMLFSLFMLIKYKKLKKVREGFPIKTFVIITIISLITIVLISMFITKVPLGITIMSLRYTFTGFIIFIVFFLISWLFFDHDKVRILDWYTKVIKYMLVLGMMRWLVIWLVPRLLEFAGYDRRNYEGDVGVRPPAVYYTQMATGYARNQFLFERPISWGFFLIAFWPMFFVWGIKNKGKGSIIFWGALYGANIISTFSRAAWITWIVLTFILIVTQYKREFWKFTKFLFLPLLFALLGLTYILRHDIIHRDFSNTGHITMIATAIGKIKQQPIFGLGAGSAGPVTHHRTDIEPYNPENQFLQVWIEYGLIGFIGWMWLYLWFHVIGYKAFLAINNKNLTKMQKNLGWLVFAFSVGILGLSIDGLVLHSFIDRMIVYPFTALFGLTYAMYLKNIQHNNNPIIGSVSKKI